MAPATATNPESFDAIVVGGGGSGLAAAIAARTLGREVLLLEKNPELGGSTAWSIGSISASATPHQIRKGIKDRPEDHWRDMPLFAGEHAGRDNDALRRVLCEAMPETFRWLLESGVRFYGPMPEPPHTKPRMHTVLPNSRAYIYHLERRARRMGVDIRVQSRAVELVLDNGRVTGIDCDCSGTRRRFLARGGVILAAGDFTSSPEFKARYLGPVAARVEGVNPTATGDGQAMAMAAGARILNGDLALGPEIRFVPPMQETLIRRLPPWRALAVFMQWSMDWMPSWLLRPFIMSFLTTALAPSPDLFREGAILVNRHGERFADESATAAAAAVAEQPDRLAYILIDARIARLFSAWPHFVSTAPGVAYAYIPDYKRNRPDVFAQADTLDELGTRLGLPAGSLAGTIGKYQAERGARPPLAEAPFIALGPVRAVFVHNEGGLAVDAEHRVLGPDERPIPGLYAAGSTGQGGLLLKGHGHHLAWAFASGLRAGRHAAFATRSADLA